MERGASPKLPQSEQWAPSMIEAVKKKLSSTGRALRVSLSGGHIEENQAQGQVSKRSLLNLTSLLEPMTVMRIDVPAGSTAFSDGLFSMAGGVMKPAKPLVLGPLTDPKAGNMSMISSDPKLFSVDCANYSLKIDYVTVLAENREATTDPAPSDREVFSFILKCDSHAAPKSLSELHETLKTHLDDKVASYLKQFTLEGYPDEFRPCFTGQRETMDRMLFAYTGSSFIVRLTMRSKLCSIVC